MKIFALKNKIRVYLLRDSRDRVRKKHCQQLYRAVQSTFTSFYFLFCHLLRQILTHVTNDMIRALTTSQDFNFLTSVFFSQPVQQGWSVGGKELD